MTTGLRERKKLKTRAAIQKEAMNLFLKRGFDATTIEYIAEAAEISPSTFFNYFPSKEDVVFQDELDPLILAAFNSQPEGTNPIAAIRNAMGTVADRAASDFALRNLAGALLGVMMSALLHTADDPKEDLIETVYQATAPLEAGLPLDWEKRTHR